MSKPKFQFLNKIQWLALLVIIPLSIATIAHNALADTSNLCSSGGSNLTDTQVRSCKCNNTPDLSGTALSQCECKKQGLTGQAYKGCVSCEDSTNAPGCLSANPIVVDINNIIKVLSGLVAIVVTATIIVGGIQYATSGDRADAVAAAKKRIINGLIALVVFMFIFSIVQWLIPGGIFNS